jgi:hypothetical protein
MRKHLRMLVAIGILLAAVGPWRVQAQQPIPSMQGSPPAPGDASFEGKVKKVDPAARTLEVSIGLFGLWGKTLEVTDSSEIQIEGRQATLADIPEGAMVKASYETRAGKSFATRIDLMPMSEPRETPTPAGPRTP